MSKISRVLFPIDLSSVYPTLDAATCRMFDHESAEIIMLHAIEEPSRSVRDMEVARAMAQMEFLARQQFKLAQVSRRVTRGRAAECILDDARTYAVDIIAMAQAKPEDPCRKSLGRVAEEVLTGASCAVWIEWMREPVKCVRHICCVVRLDASDEAVLTQATDLAAEFGAELTIVHAVVPELPMVQWWDGDAFDQEVRSARIRVEELREKLAPAAVLHVEAGRVDTLVSQTLLRLDAGLLVAAGSREAIVAATMACPVLRIASRQPDVARRSNSSAVAASGAA